MRRLFPDRPMLVNGRYPHPVRRLRRTSRRRDVAGVATEAVKARVVRELLAVQLKQRRSKHMWPKPEPMCSNGLLPECPAGFRSVSQEDLVCWVQAWLTMRSWRTSWRRRGCNATYLPWRRTRTSWSTSSCESPGIHRTRVLTVVLCESLYPCLSPCILV